MHGTVSPLSVNGHIWITLHYSALRWFTQELRRITFNITDYREELPGPFLLSSLSSFVFRLYHIRGASAQFHLLTSIRFNRWLWNSSSNPPFIHAAIDFSPQFPKTVHFVRKDRDQERTHMEYKSWEGFFVLHSFDALTWVKLESLNEAAFFAGCSSWYNPMTKNRAWPPEQRPKSSADNGCYHMGINHTQSRSNHAQWGSRPGSN